VQGRGQFGRAGARRQGSIEPIMRSEFDRPCRDFLSLLAEHLSRLCPNRARSPSVNRSRTANVQVPGDRGPVGVTRRASAPHPARPTWVLRCDGALRPAAGGRMPVLMPPRRNAPFRPREATAGTSAGVAWVTALQPRPSARPCTRRCVTCGGSECGDVTACQTARIRTGCRGTTPAQYQPSLTVIARHARPRR